MSLENFSKLDSILTDVHKKIIKIDKNESQRAYKILERMRKLTMDTLKGSNSMLKVLTNGHTDRGSFFRGVKVGKPDEFDIDVQLKLPLDYKLIKIALTEPGYIKINIKEAYKSKMETPTWAEKYSGLNQFMNEQGFLVESKIRAEIESVFTQQFGVGYFQVELSDGMSAKVRMKKSGPAFTFEVNVNDLIINIDFVYVIYFNPDIWPPNPIRKFEYVLPKSVNNYWFAVPKPTINPLSWRLSFPHQEDFYLDNSNNLKYIYRLLKALRDAEKWKLASYHIATLLLWKSEQEIKDPRFWQQSNGTLFMHMLDELKNAMEKCEINFFWDVRCNMIEDINVSTMHNIANRIGKMQKKIRVKYTDIPVLTTYIMSDMYHIKNEDAVGESSVPSIQDNINVEDSTLITAKDAALSLLSIINTVQSMPVSKSSDQVKSGKSSTTITPTTSTIKQNACIIS